MSVDPVAVRPIGDNFNRYWYANNNPYKFTDPDGRETGMFQFGEYRMAQPPPEAIQTVGLVTVAAVVAAPAVAYVGTTAAAVVTDAAAGSVAGSIAVNGPSIVVSTAIVAEGAAGASGAMTPSAIPGEALVVRGGNAANQTAAKIDAAIGPSRTPGVSGFSAQCNGGTCLSTLGGQLRNNQVGVTTAGQIRAAGGEVVRTPGMGNHVTVTNLPGAKASPIMKVVPNPNPKRDP